MSWTLKAKRQAENRMRELLASEGMPQPDEVEYGETCLRFFFSEPQVCVVLDLDGSEDDGEPSAGSVELGEPVDPSQTTGPSGL